MTTHMVRKQIYIPKRQDILLKRLSRARGVSEAEIIRQAIEREIGSSLPDAQALQMRPIDEFIQAALANRSTWEDIPYRWNREELYADRESHWLRDHDEDEHDSPD